MSEHVLGGRYRLQGQLGRGGMATVWRARDTRLDRSAAVKILNRGWRADPVALERLRREAQSVARLAHQNIVGVYDFDVADNTAYLVMELVEGRSLTDLLARWGRLPVEHAMSIAAQICDALGAAHAAGVVHRDIKPANILVNPAGVVKVCDFGVALLQRAAYEQALTGPDAVVGTCQYMAPEQATGEAVDGRADLYAVGCLLYTMLVGEPPFNGTNAIDVLDLHLYEPPVPLRAHRDDIPPDLERLVGRLLAKDAADRPDTAWSVREQLTAAGGGTPAGPGNAPTAELRDYWPVPSTPTAVVPRHRLVPVLPWLSRRLTGWLLALLAGAVVIVALAAITLAGGGTQETAGTEPPSSVPASQQAPATSAGPTPSSAGPGRPTQAPAGTPTTSHATPLDRIADLAALLQRQADAGQLQPKAAKALLRDLTEVSRRLAAGNTAAAAEKFAGFRDRVAELTTDGKLTGAGADALPDLDQIAGSIRAG